jgi:histidinol-phosphate/aromatic aminotransferase/cobyric acid decarboxylase-like protein
MEEVTYKCRPKVLAAFFKKSRDQWKQKCVTAKSGLKKATNLAQWMRTSRDEWKAKAQRLEAEIKQLRAAQKAPLV